MSSKARVHDILVLETDRLRGAIMARTLSAAFRTARVYCESDPAAAAVVLAEQSIDLFVVAVRGFDLDVLTLLGVWAEHDHARTRVLVVTPDVNSTAMKALQALPIAAVFDCTRGNLDDLEAECRRIMDAEDDTSSWTPAPAMAPWTDQPGAFAASRVFRAPPVQVSAAARFRRHRR